MLEDTGVSPPAVTMIDVFESDCRDDGTTLICSGGGAVAVPRGFACRGGGAWACTICCSRGGGGVLCICCSGGGWRGEEAAAVTPMACSPVCLVMILVTIGGLGGVATGGGWGLMAPVRERVVT